MLHHLDELFVLPPSVIHYCYGVWQDGYREIQQRGIKLHDTPPDEKQSTRWFPKDGRLLVMDDLMTGGGNDKEVLDLFTKH